MATNARGWWTPRAAPKRTGGPRRSGAAWASAGTVEAATAKPRVIVLDGTCARRGCPGTRGAPFPAADDERTFTWI